MTKAPERIWVEDERPEGGSVHVYDAPAGGVVDYTIEYVRADLTPAPVAVKPLQWKPVETTLYVGLEAKTEFGSYKVFWSDDATRWLIDCPFTNSHGGWGLQGEAEAAAQADYERRILSCLTQQPDTVAEAARVLLEWSKKTLEHDAWEAAQDAMDEPDIGDASDVFVAVLRALAEQEQSE